MNVTPRYSALYRLLACLCLLALAACQAAPPIEETTREPGANPTLAPVLEQMEETAAPARPAGALYLDPSQTVEARVEDLLGRMTLEEKLGQMTQVEKNSIVPQDITDLFIGSLLSGGGGSPERNTARNWAEMTNGFQAYALKTRLAIPLIYGADAIHGHGNLFGATIFPQDIGLGATRDPDLVQRIGRAVAVEMTATGVYWNFAPVVAPVQDIRWGRTYEGFSENTQLVSDLGAAYVRGMQEVNGVRFADNSTVVATPKHFLGDGATVWGTSTYNNYKLDRGDMRLDEAGVRKLLLPPYQAALQAGARSIMVSFSSWNGTKMHAQKYLVTDVLKDELGFTGFVVTDWAGIDEIPGSYQNDIVTAINAGIDMVMVPTDYKTFLSGLSRAAHNGSIPPERIDDAVRRILRVKFELGLFERPAANAAALEQVGSPEHRALAAEAVHNSLVLLKNENGALPIPKNPGRIFIAGQAGKDIGLQCGGWTIVWSGQAGDITPGTTILDGFLKVASPQTETVYEINGDFVSEECQCGENATAPYGIVVLSEQPYAEGEGDTEDISLSESELALIDKVRQRVNKLVLVLISGRPRVITAALPQVDAVVAAWLPGTEGAAIADVLFGDVPFTGKLPYTWPRWTSQLPFDFANLPTDGCAAPLFPYGYGLTTADPSPAIPDCPPPG